MEDSIGIFKGSEKYKEYLESYSTTQKITYDPNSNEISKAIFYHIVAIKLALINHKKNTNRRVKTTFSETFHDILAFYLKVCLPGNFEVLLEFKKDHLQPDILILKDGVPHFILEIKTTIGWKRDQVSAPFHDDNLIVTRIKSLASTFKIPQENILYVFENPFNVSKAFETIYWDRKNWKSQESRPTEFPFSQIIPLFASTNPEFWKDQSDFSKERILDIANSEIVIPFESILAKIVAE